MRPIMKFLIPSLAASVLLAACGSSSSSSPSGGAASIVKPASNSTLGATILVNAQGMTLYHLSGEQSGKWICVSAKCVHVWPPLTPAAGAALSGGGVSLGTIKRPDGTMQVTYNGMPLYTFVNDLRAGDAKGQGIKDVGTWTAVTTNAAASAPATSTPTTSSKPSGGGYAY